MSYRLTWLGHATCLLETGGEKVLIEPWVQGNPSCPEECKSLTGLSAMLITHGHFDHMGDAVELAGSHPCPVVAIVEVAEWLKRNGVAADHLVGMNKGGTVEVAGLKVTMVQAQHSAGIQEADGTISYGGEPAGFVIETGSGERIYHAGDTNVFGDMKIIGELYRPDVALLPVGDHFTMGPKEAALAISLLGVKTVIPIHWGTFPLLTGTPDGLREETAGVDGLRIVSLEPGQTFEG